MFLLIKRFFLLTMATIFVCSAVLTYMGLNLSLTGPAQAAQEATPIPPTTTPHVATAEEVATAQAEWTASAHADTYDQGMGANTTCARCKSPLNWDAQAPAAPLAQDCASCKRIPGQPRPKLEEGVPVPQSQWQDIGCEICHEPVGDSFMTSLSFWNNERQQYETVENAQELCAHCHEGRHGFNVVEEQLASPVHQGWECTRCHGAHGAPSACEDCHDISLGSARLEHERHPTVNCTACHDNGQLNIVLDDNPKSQFYGTYVPLRYAHTLTSWPSHNLQIAVDCRRCHHRPSEAFPPIANQTGCDNSGCHEGGAVLHWCPLFKRDLPPDAGGAS
jgi:hypothetical protein